MKITACPRCQGKLIQETGEEWPKCIACGRFVRTKAQVSAFIEKLRPEIEKDLKSMSPAKTAQKYQVAESTIFNYRAKWASETPPRPGKLPPALVTDRPTSAVAVLTQPPAGSPPQIPGNGLPVFPPWNDVWPAPIQEKWLDVYPRVYELMKGDIRA